jgi:RHS repeat-associated protein
MAAAPPAEVLLATIPAAAASEDPPGNPDEFSLLPCKKYVRTCGPKTVYIEQVTVPSWVTSPFRLHIQNGEPNGTHRVSSATVEVNGVEVVKPHDLNQNVASLDRAVNLTPQTTLKITLASRPSSYLRLCLFGANQDRTPPEVTVEEPPNDSLGNNTRPRLRVRYRDLVGPGEPAASGVRRSTLKILLDGHDRTHLFCVGPEEAKAVLPGSLALADGVHTLSASIEDKAGNRGEGSSTFRVDTVPPTVTVLEPTEGAYLNTDTPTIVVGYADDVALDLDRLQVLINGEDRTSLFVKQADRATAVLDASSRLPAGPISIAASIYDRAGNRGTGGRAFQVDVTPPELTVGQPRPEARLGNPMVEVIVQYRDDQALNLGSFVAKIDDQPVTLSQGPEGAMGVVGPLTDGRHTLYVAIADQATNLTDTTVGFWVDTQSPTISILQPPPGFTIRNPRPTILVTYSDAQGIDTATFNLRLDTVDRTSWCEVGPESATCLPQEDLPQGSRSVRAEIRDLAGNPPGTAESTFTVDSEKPTGEVSAPGALTNDSTPEVRLIYQDATSGIDAGTLQVFIDEVDLTSLFSRDASEAKAVLVEPLPDGLHTVRFLVSDRAGNQAQVPDAPHSFVVDTQPPNGSFTAPGAFTNDPTPVLRLAYDDGTGSGVVPGPLRVYLQKESEPEVDITSYLQAGANLAEGQVPETAPLADGSYHLRAVVEDRAGNQREILWSFLVDTVAPTYEVKAPAHESFSPTATPGFEICYTDDASGVDLSTLAFKIDQDDRTARLTKGPLCATGTLLTEEKLGEGRHQTFVALQDKAGNVSTPVPHAFWVDTIFPLARLDAPPPNSFVGTAPTPVRFVYSDENPMGVDTASILIYVDGVDRTAEFTVGPQQAEATLALADGLHVVRIEVPDWADNTTKPTDSFTVDTQPPALTPQTPADDSYIPEIGPAGTVRVTGTVTDLDPQLTVTCTVGSTTVNGTISGGQYACDVPLTEGANDVQVVVKDSTGHETVDDRDLNLDTTRPEVTIRVPTSQTVTAATAIDVSGDVQDASPVTVKVNGIEAVVAKPDFTALAVPLGDGPTFTIEAKAEDAAKHTDTDTVTIRIDRTRPVVSISTPAAGECVAGPTVLVEGDVSDDTAVTVYVNGHPAEVIGNQRFRVEVPAPGPELHLEALATDAAGNTGTAERDARVDSAAPAIVHELPQPNFVTNRDAIRVKGTVTDDCGPVTLRAGGLEIPVAPDGSFDHEVPVPGEGPVVLTLTAMDRPGNAGSVSVAGLVDRIKPVVQITIPATDGTVIDQFPVVVVGTVVDSSDTEVVVNGTAAPRTGQAWQVVFAELPDGPYQFSATATDIAGNVSDPAVRNVEVSFKPTVSITSPADGALTRHPTVPVSGTFSRAVGVTVNGVTASLSGSSFTALEVPLQPGENVVRATARNGANREAFAQVTVVRDNEPPQVDLTAPQRIFRGQPGQAEALVTDNIAVDTVTLSVNDGVVATFDRPPYVIPLNAPEDAPNGHLLVVTATAVDKAGNASPPVSADVRVSAGGVVVGQVLDDESSLPLSGATARMGAQETVTDEQGRYSFPASAEAARVVVTKDGMTRVERETPVTAGVGNVPVDARLTTLADAETIGPAGGSLAAGPPADAAPGAPVVGVTVDVPPDAVPADTTFRLTRISAQGVPVLPPLGVSPLAAFELTASVAPTSPLRLTVTQLPAGTVHLIGYDATLRAWTMTEPDRTVGTDPVVFDLPGPGLHAVVALDEGMAVPAADELIAGVTMAELPDSSTGTAQASPATLPSSGGTSRVAVEVHSPVPLPSGTVVRAELTETFTLSSGEVAREDTRVLDVLLYGRPTSGDATLSARVPVRPSREFSPSDLNRGTVHVDISTGRETIRGVAGGENAVVVQNGDARLLVPAGALGENTAISVMPVPVSGFLPASADLAPLSEAVVDFSGRKLALASELSLAATALPADTRLFVARVESIDGIPRLFVVALAEVMGDRLVSKPHPDLPGVVRGGRYVFYRVSGPLGFIRGIVSTGSGPYRGAVVTTSSLPLVSVSAPDGRYWIPALPGDGITVEARAPGTALQARTTTNLSDGQTTELDLALIGSTTTATVTPPNNAEGVLLSAPVTIAASAALDPATVTTDNLKLYKGAVAPENALALRLVLSVNGKSLSVIPEAGLEVETLYQLEASGLKDLFGGDVPVPSVRFKTTDNKPKPIDPNLLVFGFPDQDGLIPVTAAPGSFPPGTGIIVINTQNGHVLSLTVADGGGVDDTLLGTVDDRLTVTVTDTQGNVTTFERTYYTHPDGTVSIGSAGGVIADGDHEIRIPEGALDSPALIRVKGLPADAPELQVRPETPGLEMGGGIQIDMNKPLSFKKEVDLAFPIPDFSAFSGLPPESRPTAENVSYWVYRRLDGPNGKVLFETVDVARLEGPEGNKRVVTASYPMTGFRYGWNRYHPTQGAFTSFGAGTGGAIENVGTCVAMLMWYHEALLPGRSTPAVVTGTVLRARWNPGASEVVYEPVIGAAVSGVGGSGQPLIEDPDPAAGRVPVTFTQEGGRFTLFDTGYFTTGDVTLSAIVDGKAYFGRGYLVQENDSKIVSDPGLAALVAQGYFTNYLYATISLPPKPPEKPLPKIQIFPMRLGADDRLTLSTGVEGENTPLVFGFKTDFKESGLKVVGAEVAGPDPRALPVVEDTSGRTPKMDFVTTEVFVTDANGVYTVTAIGDPPEGGSPIRESLSFRIAADGGHNTTLEDAPPKVLGGQTLPVDGARDVATSTTIRIAFSEPVRGVASSDAVKLTHLNGVVVPIRLLGFGPRGAIDFDALSPGEAAEAAVSTLTIEPRTALDFATTFRLTIGGNIEDLDQSPKGLDPSIYTTELTTFSPSNLTPLGGGGGEFVSAGLAVFGDRVYILENQYRGGIGGAYQNGILRTFDVTDPIFPQEIPNTQISLGFPPQDMVGDLRAPLPGEGEEPVKRLVIAAWSRTHFFLQGEIVFHYEIRSTPANLFVYEVTAGSEQPQLVGAASLSLNLMDGIPQRVAVLGSYAYVATTRKGIQVVDLDLTRNVGGLPPWQLSTLLSTDGINNDAVVRNIPITDPPYDPTVPGQRYLHLMLQDLKVGDFVVDDQSQPIVFATGNRRNIGLVIVNPQTGETLWRGELMRAGGDESLIGGGYALAYAQVGDRHLVVVGGIGFISGLTGNMVAVVDVSNLRNPEVLAIHKIPEGDAPGGLITDIVIKGHFAIVATDEAKYGPSSGGTAYLVDLTQAEAPRQIGTVPLVGTRLALREDNILFSGANATLNYGPTPMGGVRAATLNPNCSLMNLRTGKIVFRRLTDALNDDGEKRCGRGEVIFFTLCRAARVSLTATGGPDFKGWLDPQAGCDDDQAPPDEITDVDLLPGPHFIVLPYKENAGNETDRAFKLRAVALSDPSVVEEPQGDVLYRLQNRSILPVGHTFVKGVDTFDGHVVKQGTDLKIPGRHLGLEVTRTYSSAGLAAEDDVLGPGWSWNWAMTVTENYECRTVAVQGMDGQVQVFQADEQWTTFKPQKGYHGKLVAIGVEVYEFTDKAGVRHRFVDQSKRKSRKCEPRFRLEYIEEPHGDRLVPTYDLFSRVVKVSEVQAGNPVRTMIVSYAVVAGVQRISQIDCLGSKITYSYDQNNANLIKVTRTGAGTDPATAEESYIYSAGDPRDRHQLVTYVDPNGARTDYKYYKTEDDVPGVALFGDKRELIKEVREYPEKGKFTEADAVKTRFEYDFTRIPEGKRETKVTDTRDNVTTYLLNGYGAPLEVREPMGRTTKMQWAADDIYKIQEIDPEGRVTDFGYDGNGNLTSERITTEDFGVVETIYRYDPDFNKLEYKKDPEGRETFWTIGDKGDVEQMKDAVDGVTGYGFDGAGQLTSVTDPRQKTTTYSSHDNFGNARLIQHPEGIQTYRSFDYRGRLLSESDSLGHRKDLRYDVLDRVVGEKVYLRGNVADGGQLVSSFSTPEFAETITGYWPAGQVRLSMNPYRLQTFYDLDGMNRVVGIRVPSLGYQTVIGYDGNGNKTSETDRRGVTRSYVYDALNRVEREEITGPHPGGPNGLLSSYTYDKVGNKLTETDHANLTTTFEYDGLYRVNRKLLPLAPYEESYTYDKVGNQKSVTDANGKTTSFDYDGLNRLIGTQNALGQTTTITYGDKVNKTREVDGARGLQVDYAYDGMNREVSEATTFLGTGQRFTTTTGYVNWDNSERVTDQEGRAVVRRRNGLDKVWEETVAPNSLNLRTAIAYDVLGNPLMKTDPNGNFTRSRYDGLGRLRFDFDADNKQTSYQVDGEGLRTEEIDRRGVKKTYTYDNLGRLVKTEFNAPYSGKVWKQEIVYDDLGRKRTEIDARGNSTVHHLDRLGRVVRTEYPDGEASQASYDGVNKRTETDQRGKTTKFDYDDINRLTTVTDPLGQTIVTQYLDAQNRRRVKDKKGIYTVIQTDPLDRVVSVTREMRQPAGTIVLEANTYDGSHNKVLTVDAAGNQTKFVYDAANRLVQRIDGFGSPAASTTRFEPDKNGNVVKEIDARVSWTNGVSVSRTYDRHDRVLSETDGEGNLTQYGYDVEGNLRSVTTPKNTTTLYTHDELGKTLTVTQPGDLVTTYTYDENRNLSTQKDAENHVVSMSYDAMNRLESRVQEYGLLTQFKYDPNGNLREVIDPKGQKVEMTFDDLNREKTKTFTYPGSEERPWRYTSSITYTYDANDNLERVDESVASGTDPPGTSPTTLTTSRAYDDLDRLTAETTELPDGGDRTVSYSYYENGLRKTVTDPEGVVTTYTYDALNRLKSAATAAGTTAYTYFPDGLIQDVRYPNGVTAVHAYDRADRLVSLINRKDGVVISSYAYGYDPNGNRQTQVETNGGPEELTSYTYDALDRLETITYPAEEAFPQGRFVRYEYDRVGNRIRETERAGDSGGTVIADRQGVFDDLNRLTALNDLVGSEQTAFEWDANGNQTARTQGGVTTAFRYDARDRMVEVGQGTGILGRYQYDAEGRRSKKIGAEGLRQFVYDDTATLVEYDESGAKVGKYDYGLDRLVSATLAGEGRRFYTFDALGSVTALTADDGSAVARYQLDAWGSFRRPSQAEDSRNRFAFTGYSFDRETGLYDAKTRYYDPKLGRFLSQDSFLGDVDHPPSLHRYTYVHNQPTRYVDPEGTIITNLLGGAFSVALGWGISKLTGEEYSWKDAAVDFGVGFATSGVGGLVGKINKLGKLGKFAVRAGAEIAIDLGGEVVRNEWKGTEYDVGDLAKGAVRNFAIGEGAGLLAKGTGRFGKWASKRLGESDSATGKFLARDVKSFLPGRINTPNLPPAAKSLNVEESPLGRGDPSGPGQPFHSASARPAGNSAVPPPPDVRGPPLRPAEPPAPRALPPAQPQQALPAGPQPRALIGPAGDPGLTKRGASSVDVDAPGAHPKSSEGLVDLNTVEAARIRASKARFYVSPEGEVLDVKTFDRTSFRAGVRDVTWNAAVEPSTGRVRDRVTGRFMSAKKPWDMGHREFQEYWKHRLHSIMEWLYSRRVIDRGTFRDQYNDPSRYRPELPASNRSHRGEDRSGLYRPDE